MRMVYRLRPHEVVKGSVNTCHKKWVEICKQKLPHSKLLAQDSVEILHELVDSSTLPAFSSDRAVERGCESEGRVTIPICDEDAFATYYLACLQSEKTKYNALFHAARSAVI